MPEPTQHVPLIVRLNEQWGRDWKPGPPPEFDPHPYPYGMLLEVPSWRLRWWSIKAWWRAFLS